MGGKTSTSTSSVAIPKEVMARYNAVNSRAEAVATQPFQKYSTDPNAFVAPINQQQYAGIGGINQAANMAQPYYGTAAGMTLAGAGSVTPEQYSAGAVQQYMNPYISNVADTTAAQMKNLFGQQAEELKGGAIRAGAFGGDRSGIAQSNLANQQGLAFGQQMANIYGTGFNQAQQQFNQQQGVNLAAQQADQARLLAAGQQLGGLGGAAQQSALQGAQAQLGAGTLEQQTQQAGQTALYNQFLQQQAYPFQIAQFLANIAMGTGALSGSTQTTTQPAPFFSDERVKDNIEPIGETYDGQKIVKFNYKGDKQKQIGLIAQDVERHHPEAVGLAGGIKTVDYDGATRDAARMGKYAGGLASEGGAVNPFHAGQGFAVGGVPASVNTAGLQNMIAQQMAAPNAAPAGGINKAVADEARAIAPQPVIPAAVNAPVFNPQPIPKSDKNQGLGKKQTAPNTKFTDWSDYLAGLVAGKDMNDPSLRPAVTAETPDPLKDFLKKFNGGEYENGGRIGFATYGGVDEEIARQAAMYAALDKSTVPTSRQLTAGIGAHGRVPEANLPVRQLMTPEQKFEQPKSALEEGLGAYEKGAKIAEMFKSAREGLQKLGSLGENKSVPSVPSLPSAPAAKTPSPKADEGLAGAGEKTSYVSPEFEEEGLGSFSFANRGGRMGYKTDGSVDKEDETIPYTSPESSTKKIDIPTDLEMKKLLTPQSTGQQGDNSLSNLATAVSLGKTILGFLPLETGGRVHKDDGGSTTGQPDPADAAWQKIIQLESGGRHFDKNGQPLTSPKGAVGIAQVMPQTAPEAARMAGVPFDENRYMNDEKYNAALGKAYFGHQLKTFGDPEKAAAAYNAGPGRVSNAMKKASETGADWRAFLPKETRAYIAKFGSDTASLPSKNAVESELQVNVSKEAPRAPQPQSEAPKEEGWTSKIGMNEDTLVPLLAGVGSMLSSRSPYLGSAIGEGLVGGVGAYTGLKGLKAEVAQREAQTERQFFDMAKESAVFSPTGETWFLVSGPNGYKWMDEAAARDAIRSGQPLQIDRRGSNWKQYNLPAPPFAKESEQKQTEGLGAGAPPAADAGLAGGEKTTLPPTAQPKEEPAPPTTETTGFPIPQPEPEQVGIKAPEFKVDEQVLPAVIAGVKEVRDRGPVFAKENYGKYQDAFDAIIAEGNAAQTLQDGLNTYNAELSMRPRQDEFMTPGAATPILQRGVKLLNNIASNFGMGEFVTKDVANHEAIQKQFADMRNAATARGDQRALAALDKYEEQFPGLSVTHGGSAKTMAKIIVDNRMKTVLKNFAQDWVAKAKAMGVSQPVLTTGRLVDEFNKRYGDQFQKDREAIERLYNTTVTENGRPDGKPVMATTGKVDPATGRQEEWRPYTWAAYLQEHGQDLSPKQIEYVVKTFGPNILNYFPNIRLNKGAQ